MIFGKMTEFNSDIGNVSERPTTCALDQQSKISKVLGLRTSHKTRISIIVIRILKSTTAS